MRELPECDRRTLIPRAIVSFAGTVSLETIGARRRILKTTKIIKWVNGKSPNICKNAFRRKHNKARYILTSNVEKEVTLDTQNCVFIQYLESTRIVSYSLRLLPGSFLISKWVYFSSLQRQSNSVCSNTATRTRPM